MSAEFVQEGNAVDYTPAADLLAGTVVVQGDLVGVTKHDIKANTLGSVAVEGVFDLWLYRQLKPLTLSRQATHEATVPPC